MTFRSFCSLDRHISSYMGTTYQVVRGATYQVVHGHRLLEEAEEDLLAFKGFPPERWSKLHSTNPLERINREIGRRSHVVGIHPNDESLLRLSGALLL